MIFNSFVWKKAKILIKSDKNSEIIFAKMDISAPDMFRHIWAVFMLIY
jgi:hypothetical protein